MRRRIILLAWLLVFAIPMLAHAQMEKRKSVLYKLAAFAAAKPAVGEAAPELKLKNLDGEDVSLESYRGKTIVVIKGGIT